MPATYFDAEANAFPIPKLGNDREHVWHARIAAQQDHSSRIAPDGTDPRVCRAYLAEGLMRGEVFRTRRGDITLLGSGIIDAVVENRKYPTLYFADS